MKKMTSSDHTHWKDILNLPLVLKVNSKIFGDKIAVDSVDGTFYSYEELDRASRFIASMVHSAGMGKGDNIAILSDNSPHWGISYFGILATGATTVPILPDFRNSEIRSIMEHAEVKAVFVSSKLLGRLNEGLPESVELVVNMDNFQVLEMDKGQVVAPTNMDDKLDKLNAQEDHYPGAEDFYQADKDDLAAIIYTSGTTGRSKGVMLSHENILSNAKQTRTVHQVEPHDRFLSMLPLAHTYESTVGLVVSMLNGAMIRYIDRAPTAAYLGPILKELKPTTLLTVPLIMEKIFAARIKPALYGKPLTRALMSFTPTRKILSRAAAKKLMTFFGGEVRFFGVGGAPLSPEVERFLLDGSFPYAIGYGLTETAPMLAGFGPADAVYKSVGKVMEGVDIKIQDPDPVTHEGEIVAKGSNIMKGYYKDPEKTSEVFTKDGYFRTGDLGYMDSKDILYIRGRLKNMILGPNGENIYPEEIEAVINREEYVSESLVMQYKGKLVARVHLNMEGLEEKYHHLKENAEEFKKHMQEKADEALEEIMISVNTHVARNSKLQLMILQVQPFEKTPTHKIKRFLYQNV